MISPEPEALLLLSGGVDSSALAAILKPRITLFVDYGQRPVNAERQAARAVSLALGTNHLEVVLDLRPFGSGLLLDDLTVSSSPSPEWWPFRNQFLATAGAALALKHGASAVVLASVLGDGDRHADGTADFFRMMDDLTRLQEGGVRIIAPALKTSTEDLVHESGLREDVLGWTVSCHRSDYACHNCPGCFKRDRVMTSLGFARLDVGTE